ncbi:MAG: hypothetical protein IKE22_02165 [Atopobiaceae bacterium]|nr:hypothetical protein [Atopobiaceae bacterium]
MDNEQLKTGDDELDDMLDGEHEHESESVDAGRVANTAARVAASAMLATSLTAVLTEPPRADLITLPEPTPIVQMYSPYVDDVEPAENDEDDSENHRWRHLLKLLKYLAVALLMVAAIIFGAMKGCVSCSAGMLPPLLDQPSDDEEAEEEEPQSTEALPTAA